jgi:hypothetical protein
MTNQNDEKKATHRIEDAADTEGHKFHGVIGEATEALDDAEGHKFHGVVGEAAEAVEDTEGHKLHFRVGEAAEALDDTEGHRVRTVRGGQTDPDGTTHPRSA